MIFGINTTRDISKLSQISKYHSWYLCQISLQIMLLPTLSDYYSFSHISIFFFTTPTSKIFQFYIILNFPPNFYSLKQWKNRPKILIYWNNDSSVLLGHFLIEWNLGKIWTERAEINEKLLSRLTASFYGHKLSGQRYLG